MALGIAGDKTSAAMMATSVALHQPAESLALLVAFLKSGMPTSAIVRWLGLFSVVGPLGVCLGIYLSRVATPLVDAVVVAVTAGTFMYVGFTEVVGEEFEEVSIYLSIYLKSFDDGRSKLHKYICGLLVLTFSFVGGGPREVRSLPSAAGRRSDHRPHHAVFRGIRARSLAWQRGIERGEKYSSAYARQLS